MTKLKEQYDKLSLEINKAENKLEKDKENLNNFIIDRLNEAWPVLHKYKPDKYIYYSLPFKNQSNNYFNIYVNGSTTKISIGGYFRGELDYETYEIPTDYFFGEISTVEYMNKLAKEAEEQRLEDQRKQKEKQEQYEKEEYLRLQKKFGAK